jgi:DNA-binding NarL/FixJ family response regulator
VIADGSKETSHAAARQKRTLQEAQVERGPLSAREREILNARALGRTPKEIAYKLKISESTVYVTLFRIRRKMQKLQVRWL